MTEDRGLDGGRGAGRGPQALPWEDWEEFRKTLEEEEGDFKCSKGCETEKGPAPSRRLQRTDPGPAGRKSGERGVQKQVALQRNELPVTRENLSRERTSQPPARPPIQSREPQASSRMASGHCLADTRGSVQLRTKTPESWHRSLILLQRIPDVKTSCLRLSPSTGWQNLLESCSCATCPLVLPRSRDRETCRTKRKQRLLASGKQR